MLEIYSDKITGWSPAMIVNILPQFFPRIKYWSLTWNLSPVLWQKDLTLQPRKVSSGLIWSVWSVGHKPGLGYYVTNDWLIDWLILIWRHSIYLDQIAPSERKDKVIERCDSKHKEETRKEVAGEKFKRKDTDPRVLVMRIIIQE